MANGGPLLPPDEDPCSDAYIKANGWTDCVKEYQKTEDKVPCCCAPVGKAIFKGITVFRGATGGIVPIGRTPGGGTYSTKMAKWQFERQCTKVILGPGGGVGSDGKFVATPPTWKCFSDAPPGMAYGSQAYHEFLKQAAKDAAVEKIHILTDETMCGMGGSGGLEPPDEDLDWRCCKPGGEPTKGKANGGTGPVELCCQPLNIILVLKGEDPPHTPFNPAPVRRPAGVTLPPPPVTWP
jgi:hypothetical protein